MASSSARGARGAAGTRTSAYGARSKAPASERGTLYDEITQRIIAELEAGGHGAGAQAGLPRNALSGRAYSGVNILILWGAVIAHGHPSQGWLTYAQAQAQGAGGGVRKGERGTCVFYADRFTPVSESEADRSSLRGSDEQPSRARWFLKALYGVQHRAVRGLRDGVGVDPAPLPPREIEPVGEAVIAASGVDFRVGGNRAFYAPGPDFVAVPPQPAFFHQIDYYRTALHELTHYAVRRIMPHGCTERRISAAEPCGSPA